MAHAYFERVNTQHKYTKIVAVFLKLTAQANITIIIKVCLVFFYDAGKSKHMPVIAAK